VLGGYLLDLITVGSEYLKKIQNYRATTDSGYWRGGGKWEFKDPPVPGILKASNQRTSSIGYTIGL